MTKTKNIFKLALLLWLVYFIGVPRPGFSAEKLKYGTAVKFGTSFALPALAAEEKGFWKAEGLDVEWIPFQGGAQFNAALVAGHLKIGAATATGMFEAAARGIPVMMLYLLPGPDRYRISVRADSLLKEPQDLKGAKLGIIRYGSISHAYARAAAKALKLEGQVKMVAVGGIPVGHAALRSGAIDAWLETEFTASMEAVKGLARRLVNVEGYVPQERASYVVVAHKEFVKASPALVKRIVSAISHASLFIIANPDWAVAKLKTELGLTEEGAREEHRLFSLSKYGRIEKTALENLTHFLVEYGLASKEKMPRLEDIYTNEFVP